MVQQLAAVQLVVAVAEAVERTPTMDELLGLPELLDRDLKEAVPLKHLDINQVEVVVPAVLVKLRLLTDLETVALEDLVTSVGLLHTTVVVVVAAAT